MEGMIVEVNDIMQQCFEQKDTDYYKNAYKLCEARSIAAKLTILKDGKLLRDYISACESNKQIPLEAFEAARPPAPGTLAATSGDPSPDLPSATPPCRNFRDLRTMKE
eukprot:10412552-Alexandrium_andersonii.AAC.1